MNATTFFTEQQFNNLKELIAKEETISSLDTPFRKLHEVNGNTYELTVLTGRYVNSNEYYFSIYEDHNFKGEYGRVIGGGNCVTVNLNSWADFKECINKCLKKSPDYTEDEEPQQISLFNI